VSPAVARNARTSRRTPARPGPPSALSVISRPLSSRPAASCAPSVTSTVVEKSLSCPHPLTGRRAHQPALPAAPAFIP
jgi:hypothetical protein